MSKVGLKDSNDCLTKTPPFGSNGIVAMGSGMSLVLVSHLTDQQAIRDALLYLSPAVTVYVNSMCSKTSGEIQYWYGEWKQSKRIDWLLTDLNKIQEYLNNPKTPSAVHKRLSRQMTKKINQALDEFQSVPTPRK